MARAISTRGLFGFSVIESTGLQGTGVSWLRRCTTGSTNSTKTNLLDSNGEYSGVDGRAASSGDREGVGSGGGVESLRTGGPATAAGTSAGDDRDQAGKEADGKKERLSANAVARPCGGAPNSATTGGD